MPSFWELITGKKKGLMTMSRSELRQQEILLTKQRDNIMSKIEKLDEKKQSVFKRGAKTKSPELRRALASEFESLTTEQIMHGRQLNIKSKELMTVTRVRMVRQNRETSEKLGLGRISESDMLKLAQLIESDSVTSEVYAERLDDLLGGAAEADKAALGEPDDATAALMHVWDRMDRGAVESENDAFEEADEEVRARQTRQAAED